MTNVSLSLALFFFRHVVAPNSMATSAEMAGACLGDAKTQCPGRAWGRQDQGVPQDTLQRPIRRLPGSGAQGCSSQGLCG